MRILRLSKRINYEECDCACPDTKSAILTVKRKKAENH